MEVPKSLLSRVISDDQYIISEPSLRQLMSECLVKLHPSAGSNKAWTMAAGPPTEVQAFSKYSFKVGLCPLLNHLASTKYDLQRFAHCNKNNHNIMHQSLLN